MTYGKQIGVIFLCFAIFFGVSYGFVSWNSYKDSFFVAPNLVGKTVNEATIETMTSQIQNSYQFNFYDLSSNTKYEELDFETTKVKVAKTTPASGEKLKKGTYSEKVVLKIYIDGLDKEVADYKIVKEKNESEANKKQEQYAKDKANHKLSPVTYANTSKSNLESLCKKIKNGKVETLYPVTKIYEINAVSSSNGAYIVIAFETKSPSGSTSGHSTAWDCTYDEFVNPNVADNAIAFNNSEKMEEISYDVISEINKSVFGTSY